MILDAATSIANEWTTLAIAWHVAFAAFGAALIAGWRPTNRLSGQLLAAPMLSVAILAGASGNPFNAATFLILGCALVLMARRLTIDRVRFGSALSVATGELLVAFGWGYRHFLASDHWIAYAYAAPLGLIPCPTLSAVIGMTLILNLLGSPAWSSTLAFAGVVYGAVGVFTLGVGIDWVLLAGATVLHGVAASRLVCRFRDSSVPRPDSRREPSPLSAREIPQSR